MAPLRAGNAITLSRWRAASSLNFGASTICTTTSRAPIPANNSEKMTNTPTRRPGLLLFTRARDGAARRVGEDFVLAGCEGLLSREWADRRVDPSRERV